MFGVFTYFFKDFKKNEKRKDSNGKGKPEKQGRKKIVRIRASKKRKNMKRNKSGLFVF